MHDLNTIKRLNDTAACGIPVNQARVARDGVVPQPDRHGWVPYPIKPSKGGGIVEDLDTICALIGSTEYEWKREERIYIRRVQD